MYETHLGFCAVCSFAENFVCMWDVMRGHCVRVFEECRFALLTSTGLRFPSVGLVGLVSSGVPQLRCDSDPIESRHHRSVWPYRSSAVAVYQQCRGCYGHRLR